eukprot:11639816-Prorocentrum_lima.AAC.1
MSHSPHTRRTAILAAASCEKCEHHEQHGNAHTFMGRMWHSDDVASRVPQRHPIHCGAIRLR